MTDRAAQVRFNLTMMVSCQDGSTFTTDFSSKWFMDQYILAGPLPHGTHAAHLEDYEVEDRLFTSVSNVCTLFNTRGKVRTLGWVKRGEVQDQGVDQPNNGLPYNAQRVMVEAGTLNYHITQINPMIPENIDLDQLNQLRFELALGNN